MTITLTSEDGRLAIGSPVRVTVRSAVFGGLAVGLTVAALLFLAAWWFNHVRRTRRGAARRNSPGAVMSGPTSRQERRAHGASRPDENSGRA